METEKLEVEDEKIGCPDCEYTGEVENLIWDDDSKTYQPDGTRPCHCQAREDDDESLQDRDI